MAVSRWTVEPNRAPSLQLNETTVTNLRIGIQTRSLRQPLRRALVTAARLGADGVEIDARTELPPSQLSQTGLRQFRKLLDDYRLCVSAVAFPTRRGFGDREDLERRVVATQAAMRMAFDLGANVVILQPGHIPASYDDPAVATIIESLTALGMFGERVGARPALLPGGETPAELLRLLSKLPDGLVGIDFHPAAILQAGQVPAATLDVLGPHILHVHACDAVPVGGPGRIQEVDLGRGIADLPALLGQLTAQFDYASWVTVERRDTPDPVTSIGNAVEYLRSI
jgi:sugar phosphate isomerase/epimerase